MVSRRALFQRGLFALGSAGLLLPRRLLAGGAAEHKFLFVFCPGGWDTTCVFAPVFNDYVDHDEGDVAATIGDFALTDAPGRPSVRAFFERWGAETCLVNGLLVPSVAHDVCTLLTMTGSSRGATDDWVSIIAGRSETDRLLPNIHISGPLFPRTFTSASVRIGASGQLAALSTGTALRSSTLPVSAGSTAVQDAEEAFVRGRVDAWAATARPGTPARYGAAEQLALSRADRLADVVSTLGAGGGNSLSGSASILVRALAGGLSRTGMLAYGAGGNGQWDTHTSNDLQSGYFETLFRTLGEVVASLAAAPGEGGGTLLEETTVVVLSEMARTPLRNAAGGKDHWTWTSALLIGAGVAGGRTIGGWKDDLSGAPVDLASGDATDTGETLLPGHLGATLLAIAGLDPGDYVDETLGSAITGALG